MSVDEIIARAGGVTALAKIADVDYSTVCGWRRSGKIPIPRANMIALSGLAELNELRPDVFVPGTSPVQAA